MKGKIFIKGYKWRKRCFIPKKLISYMFHKKHISPRDSKFWDAILWKERVLINVECSCGGTWVNEQR